MRRLKLKQFLMKTGLFDKKEDVIKALHEGLIFVDDKIVKNTDFGVKSKHVIKYNGKVLELVSKNIYLMLNKPKGCLCQKGAEFNVYQIIRQMNDFSPEERQSLFIVGRLDKDTTGLLILSNDGKLADEIMKPNKKVVKTYVVLLDKDLLDKDKISLEKGVKINVNDKDYVTMPSEVDVDKNKIRISIYEGKKRQIRQMFLKLGYTVVELERVSIGNLHLGNLKQGEYKKLSGKDIRDGLR
ncbi:MAG: pseudouridine synthase [Nanoarchaeota archaeon]|nr:pseudouridine synthase [Nanoarchaeota archaeon]